MQPPQTESFPPPPKAAAWPLSTPSITGWPVRSPPLFLTSSLPLNAVSGAGMALTLYGNLITRRKAESQPKEEKAGQQRDIENEYE